MFCVFLSIQRDANVADNGNTQSLERDWIQRIREPGKIPQFNRRTQGSLSPSPRIMGIIIFPVALII